MIGWLVCLRLVFIAPYYAARLALIAKLLTVSYL